MVRDGLNSDASLDRPMRFAYADPPYPGKSRKYYRDHEDYAGEVDHEALIARLEAEFPDGWALSTSAAALQQILPLCPQPRRRAAGGGTRESIRILSWCKPVSQPGMGGPLYGWEPVILRGGRRDRTRNGPRDWLVCSPDLFTLRARPEGHVTGAKPTPFLTWLFHCMGATPGDELVDLFPGSGAVAHAWEAFSQQMPLTAEDLGAEVLV
jgi:hypothetical protein